ncbi:MAG TPA: response regulator [Rhodocyclaceae bacterium]|nr:response regulator [Rhodocyclaceae bacterium]HNM81167.1 response regulator [Rhodocyclaceae bacterium]
MFGGFPFRRPSFGNSLILRIGLLIFLALLLFALGSYQLIVRPTIRGLAQAQMGLVSEQLQARVTRLLQTVEVTLRSSQGWGKNGGLDQAQVLRFNEFFFPIIAHHGEISSVIFAEESGREILLLLAPDGRWINRITNPAEWGRQTYWLTWSSERTLEKVEMRELDYDARRRPWFKGAMALPNDQAIHWTEPYIFFTTREPGISASMRWTAADGRRYIIGHDVRLIDLSTFTSELRVGNQGVTALFDATGRFLALPHSAALSDREKLKAAVLKTPAELGMGEIAAAGHDWKAESDRPGQVLRYSVANQDWFSLFTPVSVGHQRFWLGVFAPEDEFVPGTTRDRSVLAFIALLSLLAGVFVAIRIGRQFGAPLERLAGEAKRIGRMELDTPVTTDAPWREVRQLAGAQETMRQRLREATHRLDEANAALEATVEERTRELEESRRAALESETFFRAIFDNAAIGISNLAPDLHRLRVNRAFAEFTGYSADELLAGTALDLLAPDERERIRGAYEELARGETARFRTEARFLHKDGHPIWADVQLTAIRDGDARVVSLLATVLDVTDRRIVEEELARQFALLQALLDTIPNPIFYKGAHTRFLGCNAAYEAAFGIDRHSFIGRRVLDLEFLPEADRVAYQAEDEAVIRNCGRVSREVTMVLADGRPHDALYSVTGFRNPDGTPGGLIGLIVDITDLKDAERAASAARAEAEAAAAAKADFLANMSHEIRTPMNAIVGMTHLAQQTDLNPRQRNYLDKIDAAAKGLLGIINDILDFSKIEAGMMRLEQADFDLEEVFGRLADLSVLKARDKGIELLFDVAPDVPRRLRGDSLRLGQVLINLVGNALKFTERGEITVSVALAGGDGDGFRLAFAVRDTGVGIAPEEADRLFVAFSQADSSTTRRYGGTGLGLSICKRIIELMDGDIGVDSTPGLGSRFHFTARFFLPQSAEPIPARGSETIVPGLSVLVVDDNAAAREVFLHIFAGLGIKARASNSGEEALAELARAAAAGDPYGLLLADWQMPGLDGVETVRRLRAAEMAAATPAIVMTTAYDRDELTEAVRGLDVGAVLPKPVTASALCDGIAAALRASGRPAPVAGRSRSIASRFALAGLRVLLVEDHAVNRELAEEILAQAGVQVESAENGVVAVERLRSGTRFDAVLMDCHMPVMDGYEATRLLRGESRFARLPILAMTAGALASDRERCLACGMNDYIAKPIDVADLYARLARWTGRGESPAAIPPPPPPASGEPIDAAAALARLGGDARLYRRLVERFAEQQSHSLDDVRAALSAGDAKGALRIVHTLKGLAGNIGAHRLESAAQEILVKGAISGPEFDLALAALENRLSETLAALPAVLGSPPRVVDTTAPILEPNTLDRLLGLLTSDDAHAVGFYLEHAAALRTILGDRDADALNRAVTRYDFDEAAGILRRVRESAAGEAKGDAG